VYRVVIPARYGPSRLTGKPLTRVAAKPTIQWVYERAQRSRASEVVIATDDERIAAAAREFGAPVVMTAITHLSGTDRIAEVAHLQRWEDEAIVVNVQGDEPLMPPELIEQAAALLEQHADADIGTLASRIVALKAFLDPNVVKVVTDGNQRALYFSRAPIPWNREGAAAGIASQKSYSGARRHIGIYAYRVSALRRLASLPPTTLEQLEKLEQLRALENGFDIRVADSTVLPGPDVNTAEDIALAESLLGS